MTPALLAHFRKMQDMGARYVEPAPYVDETGYSHCDAADRTNAFVLDILIYLDGPEARAALAEDEDPIMPEIRALQALPNTDTDGWIKWEGGECPIGPDVKIRVKFRPFKGEPETGKEGLWDQRAGDVRWKHEGSQGDIIAYRIIGDKA